MRQLDTFQSYLDNDGNPLIGRLRFCNKADDSPAVVRNSSGTSLGSTLYTNGAGRCISSEVYLEDKDYRIYFDKYTGETNMESDTADESWQEIGNAVNIYRTINVDVDTKGLQAVASIASLRALNPESVHQETGVREIMLIGYFNAGDKAPVHYKWDSTCSENDNGGSYIQVTIEGQPIGGRWVMVVESDKVDVVDFGCFGNDTCIRDGSQCNKIANAKTFCTQKGYALTIMNPGFYDITNLTISNRLDMGVNSYLCCHSSGEAAVSNASVDVKAHVYNTMSGNISIQGQSLKSSQNVTGAASITLIPTNDITLDNDYAGIAGYSNVTVFITAAQTNNKSFTNCNIITDKKLGGTATYSFFRCHVYKRMFADNFDIDTNANFTNCWSMRSDWDTDAEYNAFGKQAAISADNAYISGNIGATGSVTIGNGVTVSAGGATITGNTNVTGNVNATGTLGVGGDCTVNGEITVNRLSSLGYVNAGSMTCEGNLSCHSFLFGDIRDISGSAAGSPSKVLLSNLYNTGSIVLVGNTGASTAYMYIEGSELTPSGLFTIAPRLYVFFVCTYFNATSGAYQWRAFSSPF